MTGWALDLGTTNTGVARFDADAGRPHLVDLPAICRRPGREDPLEAPRMVPSATHVLRLEDFWSRVGRWGLFERRFFWGQQAAIGREALALNEGWKQPNFAPGFKTALGRAPHQTIARVRNQPYSAREVARLFLRELLRHVHAATGHRIRDLVITTPIESYDAYRAELTAIGNQLGIKRLRYIDEPVAAAIGYGLGVGAGRRVLVADFGGGTFHLAVVELNPRELAAGTCTVLAKEGRPIGGNRVDEWLLRAFAQALGVTLPTPDGGDAELWYHLLLDEARRVKEAVYFEPKATFALAPPEGLVEARARLQGRPRDLEVTRDEVIETLEKNSLYALMEDCADGIARQLAKAGLSEDAIDEVLMVGGSTLLPQVFGVFEKRYGRDRVRAWQPFEAVAYGASAYAAGRFGQSDFIVHDYAFVTYDPKTHEKRYTTIVPRGTRFPTPPDLWKRQLVPTCALGEPERIFKLVVCEIGGGGGEERRFTWDADGNLHRVGGQSGTEVVVVPLNEANPTLGHLDPPHEPGDQRPRLEISFGVNADRWLVTTVVDLKTRKPLLSGEPVARLL